MTTETINIKLGLSGTYWRRQPEFSVSIDGEEKHTSLVKEESGKKFFVDFDVELAEEQDHVLEIRLFNKMDSDTVQDESKTKILKDMLLNIESLEIDGISIDRLLWEKCEYIADNGESMSHCVNLGKNGTWSLKFQCPFYIWLLENM